MKMGSGQQQQPQQVVSHLNNDIYNNGLKFERDRTFRNRLIMKAIIIMAALLIMAVVLSATMAKTSGGRTNYNQTKTIKIRRVPINIEPDDSEEIKDREVWQDLKTSFIPTDTFQSSIRVSESFLLGKKRSRREGETPETSGKDNSMGKPDKKTDLNTQSTNSDVIWLTGADSPQNKDIKTEVLSSNSTKTKPIQKQGIYEKFIGKVLTKVHDQALKFWKGKMDKNSIRTAQAEKMLSFMDTTVDPCDDFYQYACGNWEKANPIPESRSELDTFEILRGSLYEILNDLLVEPLGNDTSESVRKAKDLYDSCMNKELIEKRGNEPLYALSLSLKGWPMIHQDWNSSNFDWLELTAELRLYNQDILLTQWVGPDRKSSGSYIVQFDQSSLALPRRYFLQKSHSVHVEAYKNYIIQISTILGADKVNVTEDAEDLINFEAKLAGITSDDKDRRNVSESYLKMSLFELTALVPQIDWIRYLTIILKRKVEPEEKVVVFALKYFKDLVKLIEETPPRVLANYLMWRFMTHRVANLGKEFEDAIQDFMHVLTGRSKAPSRWNVCVNQVNNDMGMVLGSMFVERYYDEFSKNDTLSMTQDIMNSFRDILNSTEWINDKTKSLALDKVNAMVLRIGYPDFILNNSKLDDRYKNVNISKNFYFENTLNLLRHEVRLELDRLGTEVNKTHWDTPPTTINAYYSRNKNQIMFPAGILQPPFYHKYFPRSLKYGGIGVVIGHEITHGFDDHGRLFDKDGNLDKWWDEGAIERFHQKTECLINQYSAYKIGETGIQIDGVHTQGENIADNGGIKQAFKAYEKWVNSNNPTDETLPGLNATNFQLFFLNFAHVWCEARKPGASTDKLKMAIHSPGKYRVIGTLTNSEDFAKAFNCSLNTKMNPGKKCVIW